MIAGRVPRASRCRRPGRGAGTDDGSTRRRIGPDRDAARASAARRVFRRPATGGAPVSGRSTRARALARCPAGADGLGLAWRVARYAACPPLWGDEAFIAVSLLTRDFAGLLRPLEYYQIAPVGFLWAELAVVRALGRVGVVAPADPVPVGDRLAPAVRAAGPADGRPPVGAAGGRDLRGVVLPGPARDRGQALRDRPPALAGGHRPGLVDLARPRVAPPMAGAGGRGRGGGLVLVPAGPGRGRPGDGPGGPGR